MNRRSLIKYLSVVPFAGILLGSELTEKEKIKNFIDSLDKNQFTIYHVKNTTPMVLIDGREARYKETKLLYDKENVYWGYVLQKFDLEQLKKKCSTDEKMIIVIENYEWFSLAYRDLFDSMKNAVTTHSSLKNVLMMKSKALPI